MNSNLFNGIAKGELIFTTNGLKKIEEIKPKDEIYSIKNDLSLCKNRVKRVYKGDKQEVYKTSTKTGKTILTTINHKFLSTNVKYLADRNILPQNIVWKKTKKLLGNKITVVNKYPSNNLKSILKPEIALVLGYLIGNGYVNKKKAQCNIAIITIQEVKLIKKIIDTNFNLDCQIRQFKHENIFILNITGGIKNRKGAGKHTNQFWNFLQKNNINHTGVKKEIPNIVLDAPNNVLRRFLAGLFQADGCCSKHGNSIQITYQTISKKLAKQTSHCLLRLGIQNSLYKINQSKSGFRTKNSIAYQINVRSFSIKKFINEIGFMKDKQIKALNLSKKWQPNSKIRKENVFFDIIKKIEKAGWKEIYNIETETINNDDFTRSFCCEDIIVHT